LEKEMNQAVQAVQSVGLVGLGVMGRGVAANLLKKGFKVVGRDVNPEALTWLESIGGRAATAAHSIADHCDVVISFVVNDKQTEDMLFGTDGLASKLKPNSVLITCSTMAPKYVRDLAQRLAALNIHLVDAPVTGGKIGAANGTLTIMVAGEPTVCAKVKPILETFGSKIFILGTEQGMGSQMKVVNQLLCGVHIAAAGEALAMAKRAGLPLETTLEILKSGAASSWMLGDRGNRMITESFDDVTSATDIFVKDLGLVLDAAREQTFAASMAHAAFLQFTTASSHGLGRLDDAAVIKNYTD
jgi:3-hydroxyisobutyrate dehydrogenase